MENGIIVDGRQYELQEVDPQSIGEKTACNLCDLQDECDLLIYVHGSMNLCEMLHRGGDNKYAYRYIGKEEEK